MRLILASVLARLLLTIATVSGDDFQDTYTKLLVATGVSAEKGFLSGIRNVEIIDLSPDDLTCDDAVEFPISVSRATGALLTNRSSEVWICGGLVDNFEQSGDCYMLNTTSTGWMYLDSSRFVPLFAAASWRGPGDRWLITGGATGSILSEREYQMLDGEESFDSPSQQTAKDMDDPLAGHSLIRYVENPDQSSAYGYMVVGGHDITTAVVYNTSWILDFGTDGKVEYAKYPDLSYPRSDAFAGRLDSEDGSTKSVVVAGGAGTNSAFLTSTEIFDFSSGEWIQGPELPESGVRGGASVQFGRGFLAVGGYSEDSSFSDKILFFDPDTEAWVDTGKRLKTGRAYAVALLVPDGLVSCR